MLQGSCSTPSWQGWAIRLPLPLEPSPSTLPFPLEYGSWLLAVDYSCHCYQLWQHVHVFNDLGLFLPAPSSACMRNQSRFRCCLAFHNYQRRKAASFRPILRSVQGVSPTRPDRLFVQLLTSVSWVPTLYALHTAVLCCGGAC